MTPEEYLSSPEVLAKHTKRYRLDFEAIATELGCHPNTVRSRTKEAQEALRQQREVDILEALNSGQSVTRAARALEIDRSVVKALAEKRGLAKRKTSPEARRREALHLIETGLSFAKVAKELGVSASTAYRDVAKETSSPDFPPEPKFNAKWVGLLLGQFAVGRAVGRKESEIAAEGAARTPFTASELLEVLEDHPRNYYLQRRHCSLWLRGEAEEMACEVFAETTEEELWALECRRSVHWEVKKRAGDYGLPMTWDEKRKIDAAIKAEEEAS